MTVKKSLKMHIGLSFPNENKCHDSQKSLVLWKYNGKSPWLNTKYQVVNFTLTRERLDEIKKIFTIKYLFVHVITLFILIIAMP